MMDFRISFSFFPEHQNCDLIGSPAAIDQQALPSADRRGRISCEDALVPRNSTAPIRSSALPIRPSLIFCGTIALKAASSKRGLVIGVSMSVRAMTLEPMPCGARSSAIALDMPPHLAHELRNHLAPRRPLECLLRCSGPFDPLRCEQRQQHDA